MGISEPKIRYTILEKKALSHTVISQWHFFVLFFWLKRHLTAGAKQEGGGGVQKIIPLPPQKKCYQSLYQRQRKKSIDTTFRIG